MAMIVNPSPMNYINMICSGMLLNLPVTPKAVNDTNTIFGPDVAYLKCKTTRITSNRVVTEYVKIPEAILYLNKTLTLVADVMFVDGLTFFISTLRKIKFTVLEYIPKKTKGRS